MKPSPARFFVILIVVLAALAACAAQPRMVNFGHVTYTYQGAKDNTEIYVSPDGQTLQIEPAGDITRVTVNGQTYIVKGTERDLAVTFPNGRELAKHYEENASAGSADLGAPVTIQEWDQVDDLHEILFHTKQNQQNGIYNQRALISVILFGIGLLTAAKPRLAWQLGEGWRYANLEPSELYLGVSRLAGVVLMLVALFVAFMR